MYLRRCVLFSSCMLALTACNGSDEHWPNEGHLLDALIDSHKFPGVTVHTKIENLTCEGHQGLAACRFTADGIERKATFSESGDFIWSYVPPPNQNE